MRFPISTLFGIVAASLLGHVADSRCFGQETEAQTISEILKDISPFRNVSSVAELPAAVVAKSSDRKGRLANPCEKWQDSDYVQDESLARARLIWASTNGEYYVTHFEWGGTTLSYFISIVKVPTGESKPTTIWYAVNVGQKLSDYSAFLKTYNRLQPERDKWPKTVAEAVNQILAGMSKKDKEKIRTTKREDLIQFHLGWGTGIRNELGLWKSNHALMEDCNSRHPEDASMVIIEAVWAALQKE